MQNNFYNIVYFFTLFIGSSAFIFRNQFNTKPLYFCSIGIIFILIFIIILQEKLRKNWLKNGSKFFFFIGCMLVFFYFQNQSSSYLYRLYFGLANIYLSFGTINYKKSNFSLFKSKKTDDDEILDTKEYR